MEQFGFLYANQTQLQRCLDCEVGDVLNERGPTQPAGATLPETVD